ncbi:MAG TPA: tRNA-dihydrouridine synthase, partial [Saprospiraceae bacterium]|nr:tRNA-dihydrouridine synthase [Saprospiraceae bacterium]
CKRYGADMMYTEFISADGLVYESDKSFQKLEIFDYERPIGIQYFGGQLDSMIRAAHFVEAANPDVIDINFGCPVAKV